MKIGYSRVDITPNESVPLGGMGNSSRRMSQRVLHPLCSACIAFTDEQDNTVLLIQNDMGSSPDWYADLIRSGIEATTGVARANIVVHATHTHSFPDIHNKEEESIPRFIEASVAKMVDNAVAALNDRRRVTFAEMAKTYTKGMNFVRHYVLEDGNYKGDNFGDLNDSPYEGHATEADNEMRLVKFHRAGAPDVLLCNWQTHPHRSYKFDKHALNADIIGVMRDEIEDVTGCRFIYFSGAGGNVNPRSRMSEEDGAADYIEQGKALARYMQDAEQSYEPLELGSVKIVNRDIWEPINRPDEKLLEGARLVHEHFLRTNNHKECRLLGEPYGIQSPYAAGHYIRRAETKIQGLNNPFTAIGIGDLAFITVPYEMFDTNGKYVRDQSPFKMTMVASLCNDSNGYVPSAYAYIHGCYEADCSYYKPGTGERFAYAMVRMLEELKK